MEENHNEQVANTIGHVSQIGNTASSMFSAVKSIVGMVILCIVIIYFMTKGLPVIIGLPFILFMGTIFLLQIIRTKRIATSDLKPSTSPAIAARTIVTVSPDEKVVQAIGGIMRTGLGLRSITILGAGEVRHPENAMIITDKHVLFVYVPLAGGDKVIGETDIGQADWLLASGEIKGKLNTMLTSMSLVGIYESYPNNFGISIDTINTVDCSDLQHIVTVITKDNQTYSYSVRSTEDYESLKQVLKSLRSE